MSILKREIIYPGKSDPGIIMTDSKMTYHFKTVIYRSPEWFNQPILIDDSRVIGGTQKPMETVYGKEFKLPIWESCLTAMKCGEVCRLTVKDDPTTHYICLNYVFVSKIYRKYCGLKPTQHSHHSSSSSSNVNGKSDEKQHHDSKCNHNDNDNDDDDVVSNKEISLSHNCCMNFHRSPYKDLNDLVKNPPEIFEFTFELISVQPPQDYERDTWQLSVQEKLELLPRLREDGNRHYGDRSYDRALRAYEKALAIVETLAMDEKPKSQDWLKLDSMKIPYFLNMAQVKLAQCEYYDCIRCCTEVLKRDPNNVKAFYRRARAHASVWNLMDARNDYARCLELDPSSKASIIKMLDELNVRERMKDDEDRHRLRNMFGKFQSTPASSSFIESATKTTNNNSPLANNNHQQRQSQTAVTTSSVLSRKY